MVFLTCCVRLVINAEIPGHHISYNLLLSEQGSIYLRIDYKIDHYVKIIMDEIFGIENFKNGITRIKCNPKNFARKAYGNMNDLILLYSKSKNLICKEPKTPYSDDDKTNYSQKPKMAGNG